MSTWLLLFRKEMLESTRNYKWIWIPLVFLLLGISNPVTTYFMPQILESSGVAADLVPVPTSVEIMAKSLSQYGTLGLLILALSFMGIVAAERQSGSAIMVLVKPVSHRSYILAKWSGMTVLTLAAVGLGQLGTWYYTNILFESVPFRLVWTSLLVYALWLLFINTITLFLSCLMKSVGGIAFISLGVAAVLAILTQVLDHTMKWSPSRLTGAASQILLSGQGGGDMWLAIALTIAFIAALLAGSVTASRRMWTKS
ncbi:ABC transporter permease [Cohnella endophytica]|uniref:ABC transporter permease n=1 Tax=Cohnella endophytica TaxID=2419778 RepID=A0A494XVE2_9BACL|nr:ABC transporter permease subunit [Cohnella endophytica]RKP51553.1 ABC transporter permease [Cohnella endophytica]